MDATTTSSSTADAFYRVSADIDAIDLTPELPAKHILEQLGPPPFRKTTFPMMGFFASVYEHVSEQIGGVRAGGGDDNPLNR